jgi:hypothetical protein
MPRFPACEDRSIRIRDLASPPQEVQSLVADRTEEIGSDWRALRIKRAPRTQQREETLLHDILGVGDGAGEPPGETKEGTVVLVEEPKEGSFLSAAGFTEQLGAFFHV